MPFLETVSYIFIFPLVDSTTPYIYEIKSKKSNAESIWLGGGINWEIGIDTDARYYTQNG